MLTAGQLGVPNRIAVWAAKELALMLFCVETQDSVLVD
jgi:hypothetical protein